MELSGSASNDERRQREERTDSDTWRPPRSSKMCPDEQIKRLKVMFDSVENMLTSQDYYKDLQEELSAACPNYMTVLQTSKRDLLRNDCGIVVTGETSAGKTSLINQLVRQRVFAARNLAATGTITRIRDSEKMAVKCYTKDEMLKKEEEEVQDVKTLRAIIRGLTDIEEIPRELQNIYYVDVYLPVPILTGNVIIVDTPGIGENAKLDNMLLDFLPHAVAFVFLINAKDTGGIHDGRLSRIMKTILDNQVKMPCFDPSDVLFLTNQWDCIDNEEHSSEEENEHTKTWKKIKNKLHKGWVQMKDDHLFQISLKQVKEGKEENHFTAEYKRFETVLKETIENNQNKRVEFYYRFLKNFIPHAERGTLARLKLLERSEEDQQQIIGQSNAKIQDLEQKCEKSEKELKSHKAEIITQLADKLHDYIHSTHGKDQILNPSGKAKIEDVSYNLLGDEVSSRVENGLQRWCESKEVKAIIEDADVKIKSHVKDIESKLKEIEIEITGIDTRVDNPKDVDMFGIGFGILFISFSIVFSFLFAVVFAPITYVWGVFIGREGRLRKATDLYNECIAKVLMSELKDSFEKSFGAEYDKIMVRIFDETLPKVIESLRATNRRLLDDHKTIKLKHESFMRLKERIQQIQVATENFERACLK